MKTFLISFLLMFLIPCLSSAECKSLLGYQDIIKCAVEKHPTVMATENSLSRSQISEKIATQRINPELNSKTVFASAQPGSDRDIEITLSHTFELGGKRASRKERAETETQSIKTLAEKTREDVYIDTLLALYHAKYIQAQLDILNRSLRIFQTIGKQFRGRSKLTADQEVSLNIYDLATADDAMKIATLSTQFDFIKKELEKSVAQSLQLTKQFLPPDRKAWPNSEPLMKNSDVSKGLSFRLAKADLTLSEANLNLEKSLAWPDLKVGPTYQNQIQGSEHSDMWGFSLAMGLPIFHANGAGRAFAQAGIDRSMMFLRITESQLEIDRKFEIERYKNVIETLSKLPSVIQVDTRSKKMEALFNRGIVASSLVVEAQRQIFEFTKSKQEQELQAIEALAKIYSIDGRLNEMEL